jgi:hypothetical protein
MIKEGDSVKSNTEDGATASKDSLFLKVFNGDKLIRTLGFKKPKKAGFHRMYWNMDEKGADRPSRRISKSKRERGGKSVLPGTYTLVLTDGSLEKTQQITVAADPRLGESIAAMKEVYDTETLLEGYMQTAADAVKQLVESKQIADQFSKELSELDKKAHKEPIQKAKDISKEIDNY